MLEAARGQPHRTTHSHGAFCMPCEIPLHGSASWNLLVPFNQSWAKDSSAPAFMVSSSTMHSPRRGNEAPSPTLVGFDAERAFEELSISKGYKVEAVYVVGKKGDPAGPPEELRARELPSDPRSLAELAFEGGLARVTDRPI
jgi:hypothetical protein